MTSFHAVVRGQVQGVGFRWFVREQARALDVSGWVRNRGDGSVELLALGEGEQIATLRLALERGPRGARVDAVEELPVDEVLGAMPSPFIIER